MNLLQQAQLSAGGAVPANIKFPTPDDWDVPFPISQTDHKQLMTKSHFRSIYNQSHLLRECTCRSIQLRAMGLNHVRISIAGLLKKRHNCRV